MNLWHQRVIIFLTKVLAVICGLAFLGYFLYYNLYFKTDALIKYAPKEVVFYMTMRLSPQVQENKQLQGLLAHYGLEALNFNDLNQLVGNNFSLAFVPAEDKTRLDFMILVDLGLRQKNAGELTQWAVKQGLSAQVLSNQTQSQHILAMTSTANLLNEINLVVVKQKPNLSQRIDLVFNLKNFSPDNYDGKIFFNHEFLSYALRNISQPDLASLSYLINNQEQPVFAGLKFFTENIYIGNNKAYDFKPESLKNVWPKQVDYSFIIEDLKAGWDQMVNSLQQSEPDNYEKLLANKEFLEHLYDFDWETDILPLLDNKVQIIQGQDKQYLIAATIKPENSADLTQTIEKLIKTYIASKYPQEVRKRLPDNTYITAIVRDLNNLKFNEDEILGLKLHGIKKDESEYIYILANNHLILANSRDIITNIFNNDQQIMTWQNSGLINKLTSFSQELFVIADNSIINLPTYQLIENISLAEDKSLGLFRLILE